MFQIGFPELLTLLVLMLLLVGPKRLPEVTKFFIQVWSRLRSQYEKISNEINNEIGTEEIKKDIFNDMKLQELELEENEDNDGEARCSSREGAPGERDRVERKAN